jgi:hypothetical protein
MLYGNFRESIKATPTGENWIVELPEDNPFGMEILLHIIHSEYKLVPHNIALVQLLPVLVVSEKYDMTHLIRPWANAWLQPLAEDTEKYECDSMLRVAWELGADAIFKQLIKRVCLEYEVQPHGKSRWATRFFQ